MSHISVCKKDCKLVKKNVVKKEAITKIKPSGTGETLLLRLKKKNMFPRLWNRA